MKKPFILAIAGILTLSCSKKDSQKNSQHSDSSKITDSVNAERAKINDSIKALNNKNRFMDFSGSHQFVYQNDSSPKYSGPVVFIKNKDERDSYNVSGNIKSGNNSVQIKGVMKTMSAKHINFTGEITQSISENDNGKPYIRKGTKTFMSKDGGKTYRLQDIVNGSGFVDYIDIHF